MHAVPTHQAGGPDLLVYEEVEPPQPGEGEALIGVLAALALTEIQRAHQLSESGRTRGKTILTIGT